MYDSDEGGGGMEDASTVCSNDAAILLDDSSANFVGHTDAVYWSAFHPSNSSIVVTASGDDTAAVWSTDTNALALQLRGHADTVNWAAFNAAGTLIATASLDGTVKIWDAATGALRVTCDGPSADILWATWHPRGNVVLAGSEDCSAWLWSADDGVCMGVFAGHTAAVSCGGFTPDGRHVWTAGADASLRFWSPRAFTCLLSLSGGTFVRDAITSAAAGATYAVAGGDNGDLRIVFYRVDAADAAPAAKIAGSFTFDSSVEAVALNASETLVAAGLHNGSIVVVDAARMMQRCVMQHKDSVTQVLPPATAPSIETNRNRLFPTHRCCSTPPPTTRSSPAPPPSTAPSASGTAGTCPPRRCLNRHPVVIFIRRLGTCLSTLRGHRNLIHQFALSHDANRIASSGDPPDDTDGFFALVFDLDA